MVLVSLMNMHGVVVVTFALGVGVFVALAVPGGQEGPLPVESAYTPSGEGAAEPPKAEIPAWVSAEVRALIELSMQADGDGPNDYQEGENGDCLDLQVLYNVGGVHGPLAVFIDVDPGTGYVADSSAGWLHVDFYDEEGDFLGWNDGDPNGNVPEDADYGIVCIGFLESWPDVPEVWATWFYMDGFPAF